MDDFIKAVIIWVLAVGKREASERFKMCINFKKSDCPPMQEGKVILK